MKRFNLATRKKSHSNPQSAISDQQCVSGFRIFRPAWTASVQTAGGQPRRLDARAQSLRKLSGKIIRAAGPWRGSGDWWRPDVWARDEWDVSLIDASSGDEVLCRIYRDLISEQWYVAGIYD
jgi:protein ImuB